MLVNLALITLPIYSLLAAYSLYLRVAQYGWSVERVWALYILLIIAIAGGVIVHPLLFLLAIVAIVVFIVDRRGAIARR